MTLAGTGDRGTVSDAHHERRISYIVLAHNSEAHIAACVCSLLEPPGADADEVVVVDNGSTDGTVAILEDLAVRFDSRLAVIRLRDNQGTTAPRNHGFRAARGRYIGVVDSDVSAPPGVADTLLEHLVSDATIGLVAPAMTYRSGELQMSVDTFPTLPRKLHRYLRLRQIEAAWRHRAARGPTDVDYAISAFWLLPRHVVERVGDLDEAIFYAPEDVDYCIRIWAHGWRVVYLPGCSVLHDAQEISRGLPVKRVALSHAAGLLYLYRKHRFLLTRRRLARRLRANPMARTDES